MEYLHIMVLKLDDNSEHAAHVWSLEMRPFLRIHLEFATAVDLKKMPAIEQKCCCHFARAHLFLSSIYTTYHGTHSGWINAIDIAIWCTVPETMYLQ